VRVITLQDVEYLAFTLARENLGFDEPIPDFSTRFPHVLESCLAAPFQSFSRKSLYPAFFHKAAALFYLLIKNHPFKNGNKRIAMTTLFVFLYLNDKWLEADMQELYNFTIWVAASPAKLKAETVLAVEKFISTHAVRV